MKPHPAADLFPRLSDDELKDLAADIKARGLLEPVWTVVVDGERMLLDGRNRAAACELAGVPIQSRDYTGDDPIGFSLSQNLKRRHLTTGQRAALALEVEPLYAAEAAKRMVAGVRVLDPTADLQQGLGVPRSERAAAAQAAKTAGTSGRAVSQAKRLQEKAPDLLEQVKSGDIAIDRADRIVRDREAEQRRIVEAQKQREQLEVGTTVDIRHGDFREVLADLTGVDAIITDPPYPREFLPLLADLAAWADKVLTEDGILAVLFGQSYLPEVYRLLDGHRPYRWTMAYMTPGAGYASHQAAVQSNWKPVLVYGGGPRFADVVKSEAQDTGAKSLHHWGQDYGAFHTLVERLTKAGQTVVDPFMGSGTTLLAAQALGRHAIGCDMEAEHVATARKRLGV